MSDANPEPNVPSGTAGGEPAQERQPARTVIISAPTRKEAPVFAWLVALEGDEAGKAVQLQPNETLIGRDATRAHYLLSDPTVSSLHAKISRSLDDEGNASYTLYDMGSANGTWIEEEEVFQHELTDGTQLRLGRSDLLFKCR